MREIKFRAWNTDNDRFEGMFNIGCDGIICSSWGKDKPEWILEQFTGLHDKNGKEIYEGDIVKTDELRWIGKCAYHYDKFMLIDNRGGFSSPSWQRCEVIGTIHDNPELLSDGGTNGR